MSIFVVSESSNDSTGSNKPLDIIQASRIQRDVNGK